MVGSTHHCMATRDAHTVCCSTQVLTNVRYAEILDERLSDESVVSQRRKAGR